MTHDQEEAFELADRVVVMGDGRIEQIGDADQIHDHPASPFVARFMGATTELPVTLRAGRVDAPGLDAARIERRALPDGPATLFLRPEDITPIPDPSGCWTITDINSTGTALLLTLTDDQGRRIDSTLPRRLPEARALTKGTRVHLRPEGGAIFPGPRDAAAPAGASALPQPLPTPKENAR
ncbi:hypothetical protein [Paracoccus sp. DMF-8]|uniref:hypothetical protein n=1 Tax=Paracoccus sp. DMF-8 TaxID=3019445 RepID=UPI003204B539